MTEEQADDVPEIHVNCDKDRYFTMLLLKIHESNSEPPTFISSKLSGMNCYSLPVHCLQNSSGKMSYLQQAAGDNIFLSSDSLFECCDQQKHSKRNETNSYERLDYSLHADACINRKTFAYRPANGCYSKHKKSVQIQTKIHSGRNAIGKTVQEIEEKQNLQLLLEFQRYLSQLVPYEKLDSGKDTANHDENSRPPEEHKQKKSVVPKSFSASAFGAHRQTKCSLPSVQTKPTNVVPSRPSSFHSAVSASRLSKAKHAKDCLEHAARHNLREDTWSAQDENNTCTKRTAGRFDEFDSHSDLEREIMQQIKEIHQSLTRSGAQPSLGSARKFDQPSDASFTVKRNSNSKPPKLTRNDGQDSVACLNSKASGSLSEVAFADDNNWFAGTIAMPQFPSRRNPNMYKPRVPHHVVALATGSCTAHQPTSSKPSQQDMEGLVHSIHPAVKSSHQLSFLSTGHNQSNAGTTSGILPLQGKKMNTRKAKHRIL